MAPSLTTQISLDFGKETGLEEKSVSTPPLSVLPWIEVAKGAPYFVTDYGENWTPVGQNDAILWPDLNGLFRRRNCGGVASYFSMLAESGVTCLRLMLEYCQTDHRYLEKPQGHFQPHMIELWDDLFALCQKYRLRLLLTH